MSFASVSLFEPTLGPFPKALDEFIDVNGWFELSLGS